MENHLLPLKTVIVEDEKLSRETLASHIGEFCPGLTVVAGCRTVREAYKAIVEYDPQLVFLDIELPRENGFELLKKFRKIWFSVIFITAYSEYATRAFRVSATDFLLKPVRISELVEAVDKARKYIMQKEFGNLETLIENLGAPAETMHKLIIPNQKGFLAVNMIDMIKCEADGYCTDFFLVGGGKIVSSHHLKYYEDLLPPRMFLRVHNSCVINLHHVRGYSNQGEISLSGGLSAPLSRTRRDSFLECWKTGKK